jgi:hypothetical protein
MCLVIGGAYDGDATSVHRTAQSQSRGDRRLLKNVEVRKLIRERLDEEQVIAGEVLRELKRIGFADPRSFFAEHNNLRPLKDWTPEMAAAVASFEVIKKNAVADDGHVDLIHKIKLNPKTKALELLCRRLGLLEPEPDESGRDVPTFVFPEGTRIRIE